MDDDELARLFEAQRPRLRSIGYRLLGSADDAEDAVQEAWLRLQRTVRSGDEVDNLAGWLTTVTSRICLDQLRTRAARREESDSGAASVSDPAAGPEDVAERADAVGRALLVVLDTLTPAERVAFVMHDLFAVPFAVIAPIVDRDPAAARQLASRARRRVQAAETVPDRERERAVVTAFLAASRHGEFDDLLELLDPQAVLRADAWSVRAAAAAVAQGAPLLEPKVVGSSAVAQAFAGRARGAEPATIDGGPGFVWAPGGTPRSVFAVRVLDGRVSAIDQSGDPEAVRAKRIELLGWL